MESCSDETCESERTRPLIVGLVGLTSGQQRINTFDKTRWTGTVPRVKKVEGSMNTHGKYIYSVRCAPIAIERKRYDYSLSLKW